MGSPVTTSGSYACQHNGTAKLNPAGLADVTTQVKLFVQGNRVVPFSDAGQFGPYGGCILTPATTPPGPCLTTQLDPVAPVPNPGRSSKLTVNGAPVLLDGVAADSLPAKTPLLSVSAGQTKLTVSASQS